MMDYEIGTIFDDKIDEFLRMFERLVVAVESIAKNYHRTSGGS